MLNTKLASSNGSRRRDQSSTATLGIAHTDAHSSPMLCFQLPHSMTLLRLAAACGLGQRAKYLRTPSLPIPIVALRHTSPGICDTLCTRDPRPTR